MEKQKRWDKNEAVVLLHYYLQYLNGKVTRKEAVIAVSSQLRKLAQKRNIDIDDIYRNVNGITFQMHSMESAYRGYTVMKPASKLFIEVVELYNNKREQFNSLLEETRNMLEKPNRENEEAFIHWLSERVSPAQLSELYMSYETVNAFCSANNVLENPFLQTTDIRLIKTVQQIVIQNKKFRFQHKRELNKISSAVRYYLTYLTEISDETNSEEVGVIDNSVTKSYSPMARNEQDRTYENNGGYVDEETKEIEYIEANTFEERSISFSEIPNLSYTTPVFASYFDEQIQKISSWKQLYVGIFKKLYEDYDEVIPLNKSFYGDNKRIDFCTGDYKPLMVDPREIEYEKFLETNLNATDIVRKIKRLLDLCLVDEENVVIRYKINTKNLTNSGEASSRDNTAIDIEHFTKVLTNKFPRGYRLNSQLELRKFKRYWEESHNNTIDMDDSEVVKRIAQCGIKYEDKLFVPQKMLDEKTRTRLFSYIDNVFRSGKAAIYYEALFKEFSDEFLDHYMYNAEMLKLYLSFMNSGDYCVNKKYISKEANVNIDPFDEIKAFLIEQGRPIENQEMFSILSHIPEQKIRQTLATNDEFISNGRKEYFHNTIANLSDEDLDDISKIIKDAINDKQFISGNELLESIRKKYPYIIEQNTQLSDKGLRNAIGYRLQEQFSFKGNIISAKGEQLSMIKVFADFCKSKDSFTLDELKVLKQELNTIIYFDIVYENSLRVSKNEFVAKIYAAFKIEETDAIIDRYCHGEYIAIVKIDQFGLFPDAGFPWNSYLLEHYVAMYSQNYKLIHSNFNESACVGGIVKKNSNIENFDELVIDVLAKGEIPLQKETALQFLCDEGYLARRNYAEIEQILIKAKELRNQKGL